MNDWGTNAVYFRRNHKCGLGPLLSFLLLVLLIAGCGGTVSNPNANAVNKVNAANSAAPSSETVRITAPDGVVLVGTFLEAPRPVSPAVLLLHQWQSDRHSYDEFAKGMQTKGVNVLAIDGRGFGESVRTAEGKSVGPERTDAAVKAMLADIGAALDFLSKQKNVDPARIGIVGASYGSSLALIYAADNPKIKAVALLSPGLNYFGNMQTVPAVKKYGDRPLLLVAAEDDKDSADAVRTLMVEGANEKYQTQIYNEGGHGTGLFRARVGLEDLLGQFLAEGL